tara:strand:+ start:100 stop:291 length:192 start_codon:yes stop_codon:yes gene_type:complete
MKTPEQFAKEKNPKLFFDVELSLNDWYMINQWVKDYAEYYNKEITKHDNVCRCSNCIPKERVL